MNKPYQFDLLCIGIPSNMYDVDEVADEFKKSGIQCRITSYRNRKGDCKWKIVIPGMDRERVLAKIPQGFKYTISTYEEVDDYVGPPCKKLKTLNS